MNTPNTDTNEAKEPASAGCMARLVSRPFYYEYEECGGYDCMSSAYKIYNSKGDLLATIDLSDIEPDRAKCEYGQSEKGEVLAKLFVDSANSFIERPVGFED